MEWLGWISTVCVKCLAEALTTGRPLSPQCEWMVHMAGSLSLHIRDCSFKHHTQCSRHLRCQLPLMSLKELPIHKLILEQSLDRHDTCHDFVFCLQVNYSCVSDPTHQPLHHIPGFLFRATRCFPEHPAQGVKQSPFTIDSSNTEWHTFSLETRLEQPWHVN